MSNYTDPGVRHWEDEVERRLQRELERMRMFKNASEAASKVDKNKNLSIDRAKITEIVNSGVQDKARLNEAQQALTTYNAGPDSSWGKNLQLQLDNSIKLDADKYNVTNQLNNSLDKLKGLTPIDKGDPDQISAITDNISNWQNRGYELNMNAVVNQSNTTLNGLLNDIKKFNTYSSKLDSVRQATGDLDGDGVADLDHRSLNYNDLNMMETHLAANDIPQAVQSYENAMEKKGKRINTGKYWDDGTVQTGFLVDSNEAFEKENGNWKFQMEGDKYKTDSNNRRLRVPKSGISLDISGYEGMPVKLDEDPTNITKSTKIPTKASHITDQYLNVNNVFRYGDRDNKGNIIPGTEFFAYPEESVDATGNSTFNEDVPGKVVSQKAAMEIALKGRTEKQRMVELQKVNKQKSDSAKEVFDTKIQKLEGFWTNSPLRKGSDNEYVGHSDAFSSNHTLDLFKGVTGPESKFKPKNMDTAEGIKGMQDLIQTYISEEMKSYDPDSQLLDVYNAGGKGSRGAEALLNSPAWKNMINSENTNDQLNEAFDFHGANIIPGSGYDQSSISQAQLMTSLDDMWRLLERERLRLTRLKDEEGYDPSKPPMLD